MIIDLVVSTQTSLQEQALNRLNQTQECLKERNIFNPGPQCTN